MSQNLTSFSVSRVAARNNLFQISSLLSNLWQTFGASFCQTHYTRGVELIEASQSGGDEKPKERSAYLV